MRLSDFDYDLPGELIAQYPADKREDSRLVVFHRETGNLKETRFARIARFLQPGDLVVVNDTRVIPARIFGIKKSGARIEIFLTRRLAPFRWMALLRPSRRVSPGDELSVEGAGRDSIRAIEEAGGGSWKVELESDLTEKEFLEYYGKVPLPPYIKRESERMDGSRYQTVYASQDGSVAAPTAGLHFTEEIMREIRQKGSSVLPLTLHVGPGTFRPLENEKIEGNTLSTERVRIKKDVWREVASAGRNRRRVVAVGTTTTRVLESLAHGALTGRREEEIDGDVYICGETDLFIYPGFEFRVVDALLTNFHLPRSSLFLLVCAFGGRENMLNVYNWAIRRGLRFYSYGDVMFIQ